MGRLSRRQCVVAGSLLAAVYLPPYGLAAGLVVPLLWDVCIRLFRMSVIIAILALVGVGALAEIDVRWLIGLFWPPRRALFCLADWKSRPARLWHGN